MDAEVVSGVATAYVEATVAALLPLANPTNAEPMRAYMKDVAPFLGIKTPDRRAALSSAWAPLAKPSPDELTLVCTTLWALDEREYHYSACDLIDRNHRTLPDTYLADPIEHLLITKSWWDTVDSLGNAAVSPLTATYPASLELMWAWLDSGDRWLIRAAIQHQRGRKANTDFDLLYEMCDRFAADREFFIAKAIGWALRDATRWDRLGVQAFLDMHPDLSSVARREAVKGLSR